jgi:hypothetical protein
VIECGRFFAASLYVALWPRLCKNALRDLILAL